MLSFLLLASGLGALPAQAAEYVLTSPRAIGMGGAFTALAAGPDALLANPAGLALASKLQVAYRRSGFFDDSAETGDVLDPLRRTNPADPLIYASPGRTAEVADRLAELDGIVARDFEQSHFVASGDKWALGYSNVELWLLQGVADLERIAPAPPGQAASIAQNRSAVDAYRLHLERYSVGLAFLTPQDPFTLGVAVHHNRGGVRFARTGVFEALSADPEALMRLAEGAERFDNAEWSVDLGLMIPTKRMRLGLVARNLFFNKFPVLAPPEGAAAEIGPGLQLRAGVAYSADSRTLAALDLDLTNNRIEGSERKTRSLSLGIERWMTSWLAIRSGTTRVADEELGFVFALGTGIRLPFMNLDVAGRINRGGGFDEIVGGASFSF
jgi:hypothetical protein